jgi:hypothetical protein
MSSSAYVVTISPSFVGPVRAQIDHPPPGVQEQLDALQLCELPGRSNRQGLDGATWRLEITQGDRTRVFERWEPRPGRFRTGCLILLELGGVETSEALLTTEESWVADRIQSLEEAGEVEAGPQHEVRAALGPAIESLRAILTELEVVPEERRPLLLGDSLTQGVLQARLETFERLAQDELGLEPLLDVSEKDSLTDYVLANYASLATAEEKELLSAVAQLRSSPSLSFRAFELALLRRSLPGATAGSATRQVAQAILERHEDAIVINRCPKCEAPTVLPSSTRCVPCGADWTQQPRGALRIERCPNDGDSLREWGGETRCWGCGWPRKTHVVVCPECQAPLPPGNDLQPPCSACAWPYAQG